MERRFINGDFVRQLKQQADIVDVVGRSIHLNKAGRGYQALCPFHEEKTPSFNVNAEKNFFHCFGCGASGDAIEFLMRHGSLEFSDAIHQLADMTGMQVVYDENTRSSASNQPKEDLSILQKAQAFYSKQLHSQSGEEARDYLHRRGVEDEIIQAYGLGYASGGNVFLKELQGKEEKEAALRVGLIKRNDKKESYDFFRDRALFPIVDLQERVLGFGGRTLGKGEPKYINSTDSPLFHKGKEFYGAPQALQVKQKRRNLVVVEGYMDVLALADTEGALACLGTAFTEEHARKLLRWTDRLVFAFDGDNAGQQAAQRAAQQCLPFVADNKEIRFVFLPAGEDPQSIMQSEGKEGWQKLTSVSLSEFLLRELKEASGMETMAQKVQTLAMTLAWLPEGSLKQLMRKKAEDMAGIQIDIPVLNKKKRIRDAPDAPISPSPRKKEMLHILERFLSQLMQQPQLGSQLDEEWRQLLKGEEEGDPGLMNRSLMAAERGSGYLYGYIQGSGRHIADDGIAAPSLSSLKGCIHRILVQQRKREFGAASSARTRDEDTGKRDQAIRKLAHLADLWKKEKERKQPKL